MLTLHAAATLLAKIDSLESLRTLAEVMGFTNSRRVTTDTLRDLGIAQLARRACVSRGVGHLRCLAVVFRTGEPHLGTDPREQVKQLCRALAIGAPRRDWCVLTLDSTSRTVTVTVVRRYAAGPRLVAVRIDQTRVLDSDADALRSLAAIRETDPVLRLARMADVLGRDVLSARFYRALQDVVAHLAETAGGRATPVEKRELALLCVSRCLFLAFLEAKGWLNNDRQFLLHHLTACLERGDSVHQQLLRPLFFGTLNTPCRKRAATARAFGEIPFLNGGLFALTPLERRCRTLRFTNDALAALLVDLFNRYRFTAHEDSTSWSEAAIDPEMLGRAFESLMAADERQRTGTFYTPPAVVSDVVDDALRVAIPALPPDALTDTVAPLVLSKPVREQLCALRVLDPACGSGAFLVHTLERIAGILKRANDHRPIHEIRRAVLTQGIFGVDRNPMAV